MSRLAVALKRWIYVNAQHRSDKRAMTCRHRPLYPTLRFLAYESGWRVPLLSRRGHVRPVLPAAAAMQQGHDQACPVIPKNIISFHDALQVAWRGGRNPLLHPCRQAHDNRSSGKRMNPLR
jgi:hypothetical protein